MQGGSLAQNLPGTEPTDRIQRPDRHSAGLLQPTFVPQAAAAAAKPKVVAPTPPDTLDALMARQKEVCCSVLQCVLQCALQYAWQCSLQCVLQ